MQIYLQNPSFFGSTQSKTKKKLDESHRRETTYQRLASESMWDAVEAERAEKAREEVERDRAKTFEEWKKIIEDLGEGTASVFNAETRYDFPSVGSPNVIYKAESERRIYQWNSNELKYEALNSAETPGGLNIKVIYGGDASGTV